MRLTFLGTCAGAEPMPGRKHASFVIEQGGTLYWFDAGEGCSYTAHLLGLDLLAVRYVFVSHTHMDHVGGLPNLLWNIRKLNGLEKDPSRRLKGKRIDVFISNLSTWSGILQLLSCTEGGFRLDFELEATRYRDGLINDGPDLSVTARHNEHLGVPEDGEDWQSYSFTIEGGGKRIVYSGDVKDIRELDGCDLLLMETGHHNVEEVCTYLEDSGKAVKQVGFTHHGRAILADPEGELQKAKGILGEDVFLAEDGMMLELQGPRQEAHRQTTKGGTGQPVLPYRSPKGSHDHPPCS